MSSVTPRIAGRVTTWIIAVVAVLVIAGTAAVLVIPEVIRRVAITRLSAMTGESIAIAGVSFNPVTGRFRIRQVRVGEGGTPLLDVDAVEGRVRMGALVWSRRFHVDDATFSRPVVHVARTGPATLNISAVIERWRRQPRSETPLDTAIDRLAIIEGTVTFEDRVVQPARRWSAERLSLELHHLGTAPDAAAGSGVVSFAVGGGRISVAAKEVDVAPFSTEAVVRVEAVPLSAVASYLPRNPDVTPTGGLLDAVLTVQYDETDGLRGDGWTVLRDLVLRRTGQAQPFVTVPALTISAAELRVRGEGLRAAHISVSAPATIVDARVSPAARYELTSTSLRMQNAHWPGGGAAPVELGATLADGASVAATGTLDLATLSGDLKVVLDGVALRRLNAYLSSDAPMSVRDGVLQATLQTRHVGAEKVEVSGAGTVRGLAVAGRDGGDLASIPVLAFTIADGALRDGVLSVARVELSGDPTITDTTRSPPEPVALQRSRAVMEDLRWPPGPPARVDVTTRVATGGSIAAQGTVALSPLDAAVTVTATELDLRPLGRYVPATWAVQIERAMLSARAEFRHSASGTKVDGTASLRRLRLAGKDRPELRVRTRAIDLDVAGVEIVDGRASVSRIVATGGVSLVDGSATPPTRLTMRDGRVVVDSLTWAEGSLASVEATARLDTGGSVTAKGTVTPSPFAADIAVEAVDVDLVPLRVYLPPATPVKLERGTVTARATVKHSAGTTQVDGTASVRRAIVLPKDRPELRVRTRAIDLDVAGLEIAEGRASARRITAAGGVTLTDASVTPPIRLALRDGRMVAEALSWPQGPPARIDATARMDTGGSLTAAGTLAPSPLAADLTVAVDAVDLQPLRGYIPASSPAQLGGGVLTGRTTVRHSDGTTRLDATATIANVQVLRQGRSEPFLTAPAVEVRARDVTLADGKWAARRIVVRGRPTVVDADAAPPQRHEFDTVRVVLTEATRPSERPADLELVARLVRGGSLRGKGHVDLTSLDADLAATIEDVPIALAQPYLPPDSPLSPASGTLSGQVDVKYVRTDGPRLSAEITIRDLGLDRRGQKERFVSVPVLQASVSDVAIADGRTVADRLELRGDVTVNDTLAHPARRLDARGAQLVISGVSWPATSPARVRLTADVLGGRFQASGALAAEPVRARLNALTTDVDLAQLVALIPEIGAIGLRSGRASASAQIRHEAESGTRIEGQVTGVGVEVLRREGGLSASVPNVTMGVFGGHMRDGRFTAGRVEVDASARIADISGEGAPPIDLQTLHLVADRVNWPATEPTPVALEASFSGGGAFSASGTVPPDMAASSLQVKARAVPLSLLAPFLPVSAPLRGSLDADLALEVDARDSLRLTLTGTAEGRSLALGPRRRPPLSVEHVTASGLRVGWPGRMEADAIVLRGLSATVERTEKGEFPLRQLLTAPGTAPAALAAAARTPVEPAPPREATDRRSARPDVAVGRLAVERGYVRFVDRSTSPFYSEELSELSVGIHGLSTARDARARLEVTGVLGVQAAVDLHGEVAPFGDPFFLEVQGEIRDFPVSRVNPYVQRLFDWVARTGQVTTDVHYRVIGDRLEGTNQIVVQRLNVSRAGRDREAAERLGMPVGLAVALLKDSHGDIRLTVPVRGRLGSPEFSLRDAIATALRNVVVKAIALPFQALGKRVDPEEDGAVPQIDPVEFAPGSAAVTPAVERELQRVADFLRASPFVGLEISAVVTDADLRELAARQVTVQIQEVQRARGLQSFDTAAVEHFRERFPDRPVPGTASEIVAALREAEPTSEAAGWRLVERRLETTRRMLTERAGISAERLRQSPQRIAPGAPGTGRVTFTLVPAG